MSTIDQPRATHTLAHSTHLKLPSTHRGGGSSSSSATVDACSVPFHWTYTACGANEVRQTVDTVQHPPIFTAQRISHSVGPSLLRSHSSREKRTHAHAYTDETHARTWMYIYVYTFSLPNIIRSNHKVTNQSYMPLGGYVTERYISLSKIVCKWQYG